MGSCLVFGVPNIYRLPPVTQLQAAAMARTPDTPHSVFSAAHLGTQCVIDSSTQYVSVCSPLGCVPGSEGG